MTDLGFGGYQIGEVNAVYDRRNYTVLVSEDDEPMCAVDLHCHLNDLMVASCLRKTARRRHKV